MNQDVSADPSQEKKVEVKRVEGGDSRAIDRAEDFEQAGSPESPVQGAMLEAEGHDSTPDGGGMVTKEVTQVDRWKELSLENSGERGLTPDSLVAEIAASDRLVQQAEKDSVAVDETSQEFVGKWNRLISTTNWEKGKIVQLWRQAKMDHGADPSECTDEVWSRVVGTITPQHVGRLRRVYERFDAEREKYSGLFWSHFQAALDWNDAEMWLEGAVQNKWSVANMRQQRWQTQGAPAAFKPQDSDIISTELDEDAPAPVIEPPAQQLDESAREILNASEESENDPTEGGSSATATENRSAPFDVPELGNSPPLVQPFANLESVPEDLEQALEQCRLAILHHKMAGWEKVSLENVLAHLEALKQLSLAPSEV